MITFQNWNGAILIDSASSISILITSNILSRLLESLMELNVEFLQVK